MIMMITFQDTVLLIKEENFLLIELHQYQDYLNAVCTNKLETTTVYGQMIKNQCIPLHYFNPEENTIR